MRAEFKPVKDILQEYRKLKQVMKSMTEIKKDEGILEKRSKLTKKLPTIESLCMLLHEAICSKIPME